MEKAGNYFGVVMVDHTEKVTFEQRLEGDNLDTYINV